MSTPATQINGLLVPMGEDQAIPAYDDAPLAASSAPLAAKLQYLTADPSTGMATLADDATPNQISMGYQRVDELSTFNATAGNARARVAQGFAYHMAPSTIANDTPGAADIAAPIFAADANTPGLLSHTGTVAATTLKNRSLIGLSMGLVKVGGTAIKHFVGPIAQAIARGVMLANAANGGALYKVIDAGAGTDTVNTLAEALVPRAKHHGTVTAVEFVIDGTTLAASGVTDFTTLTLWKRDGAGGSAVSVATITTKTIAFTQWTAVTFTLSVVAGALDLLETDILTLVKTHGGSGAIVPSGALRVIEKVG